MMTMNRLFSMPLRIAIAFSALSLGCVSQGFAANSKPSGMLGGGITPEPASRLSQRVMGGQPCAIVDIRSGQTTVGLCGRLEGGDTAGTTARGGDTGAITREGGDTVAATREGGDTGAITARGGDTGAIYAAYTDSSGVVVEILNFPDGRQAVRGVSHRAGQGLESVLFETSYPAEQNLYRISVQSPADGVVGI